MNYADFLRERQQYLDEEGDRSPQFIKNKQNYMTRSNGGYSQEYNWDNPTITRMLDGMYATPSNIAGSNARYNQLQNYPNNTPTPSIDDYVGNALNYLDEMEQRKYSRPSNVQDMYNMVNMQYDVPNYDQMSLYEKLYRILGGQ